MASRSNRSPSPISSRPNNPNPNPNSRTPEIHSSTTRRSFNGTKPSALTNPRKLDSMTPANSPSDFGRRRSADGTGAGSGLRNCEEKENDVVKDQMPKASKLQSPAKGFMAPTISAASKFTPSPRKRALVERNEVVRTSISLSDGKAMFFSNISEDSEPKPLQALLKPSKKVTFLDVPQDSQNSNESLPDSVISNTHSLKCELGLPSIAPLDADPSMPPYDPKTNYLSPRPQFLYYKPNPRIEVLLNKEKETRDDGDGDDNSFMKELMSDHFSSDSEVSQDSETEKLEDTASADMVMGFEAGDLCLYDEVSEKEKLEVVASADTLEGLDFLENDLNVSGNSDEEKMEAIASADDMVTTGLEEISVEENLNLFRKNEKKSWGVSRLMCFSTVVMMLLMAACVSVSVTRSTSLEEFGLIKDLSFSDLGKFYHHSRVVATTNAKVIWETCWSFASKVANELRQRKKTPSLVKYANLSDLQNSIWNDAVEDDDDEWDYEMGNYEEEYTDDDDAVEEEYADGAYECDEGFEDEVNEQEDEGSEIEEIVPADSSELDSENREDTQSPKEIVPSSFSSPQDEVSEIKEIVLAELSELDSEYREVDTQSPTEIVPSSIISAPQHQESEIVFANEVVSSEIVETKKFSGETKKFSGDVNSGSDTTVMEQESLTDAESLTEESPQNSVMPSEDKFLAHYAVEISSFIAALSAVSVFIYQYKRIPSFRVNKKLSYESGNNKQKVHQEEKTEVDDNSLCPSEMSSFVPYSNNSKKEMMRGSSEVQSLETKTRRPYSKRESLASSSSEFTMGSHSYGSFTTFEKIPIKNANGEEEIITPVRRSSRIRTQQFTSP